MSAKPEIAWDDFRLVRAVAERGGLTRAAAHLGINHSTAFRRLAQIEAALDVALFERLRTGYRPTPAGEAMLAAAARMEADVAQFGRAVAGRAQSPAGELRVTAPASFVRDLLMPILARFLALYPAMRVEVVQAEEALNLSRRDADVAIRATSRNPPANLVGRRLSGIAWAIYGRADRGAERPGQERWVGLSETVAGGHFTTFLATRSAPERVALRLNSVDGLREAIAAGIGIGPLPCYVGDACPDLRRLGEPEPDLHAHLWLLTHADLRQAVRVRAFMDFAAEAILPLRKRFEGRG